MDEALKEYILHLAEQEPYWQREDAHIQIRCRDRRYFIIDEIDLWRLNALRELVPKLIEDA